MTQVDHHYLTYVDPAKNSNKFYCLVKVGTGWLIGYGKRSPTAGGRWEFVQAAKGADNLRDKESKGYRRTPLADLSPAAFIELTRHWTKCDPQGRTLSSHPTRGLVIDSAASPQQRSPTSRPTSPRLPGKNEASKFLKAWF